MAFFDRIFFGSKQQGTSKKLKHVQSDNPQDVSPPTFDKFDKPLGNRSIRIFISSTFHDMIDDRDELMTQVWPRLRLMCRERQVELIEVDLRWGISEEQSIRKETLKLCLDEIDKCRPFFIGILGERLGWVPSSDAFTKDLLQEQVWLSKNIGKSITELEILHGVLNDPMMADRTFFYFRDPAYAKMRGANFLSECDDAEKKLEALKSNIRKASKKRGIPLREGDKYNNPRTLAEIVLTDLKAAIDREFPQETIPDTLNRDEQGHEAFAKTRRRIYIARPDYYVALDNHALGNDRPLVISGESGGGKSALIANWIRNWKNTHKDDFVFQHYIGGTPDSAGYLQIITRLMAEIKQWTNDPDDPPINRDEIIRDFSLWLAKARSKAEQDNVRFIVVLDALNQLNENDRDSKHGWLPEFPFTGPLRLIVSTLPGEADDIVKGRGWKPLDVKPFTQQERERMVKDYLRHFGKSLNTDCIKRLSTAKPTENPLFLKILLDELRVTGTFDGLDGRITEYLNAPDISALQKIVLSRYERDYERDRKGLVGETLGLIGAARRGLSENELMRLLQPEGLLQLPAAVWSPLRAALDESLVDRGGILYFAHDYLREAVDKSYLPDKERLKKNRARLADFFKEEPLDARSCDELPWLRLHGEQWDELEDLLQDLNFLEAKIDAGMVFDLADDFTHALDALPTDRPYRKMISLLDEAFRSDIHFIALHSKDYPQAFFQSLWNSGWWYDCRETVGHKVKTQKGDSLEHDSFQKEIEPKLSDLLGRWRKEKERKSPGLFYMLNTRPPKSRLGTSRFLSKPIRVLDHENSVIKDANFTGDGRQLISWCMDGTIRVWDVNTGRVDVMYKISTDLRLSFGTNGRIVSLISSKGDVYLFDAIDRKQIGQALNFNEDDCDALFLNGRNTLVTWSYKKRVVCELDLKTGMPHKPIKIADDIGTEFIELFFHTDSSVIAQNMGSVVLIYDLTTGSCIKVIETTGEAPCVSKDGGVTVIQPDGRLRFQQKGDPVIGQLVNHKKPAVKFSRDGRFIAVMEPDLTFYLIDNSREMLYEPVKIDSIFPPVWLFEKHIIAFISTDCALKVFDITKGCLVCDPLSVPDCERLFFSPDERFMITLTSNDVGNVAMLWDLEEKPLRGKVLDEAFSHPDTRIKNAFVFFAPDSQRLATFAVANIRFWDTNTAQPISDVLTFGTTHYIVHISHDWTQMASWRGSQIRLWNVPTLKSESDLIADSTPEINAAWNQPLECPYKSSERHPLLSISPDGRMIATVNKDDLTRIWDVQTGELLCEPLRLGELFRLSFSYDNTFLLTILYGKDFNRIAFYNLSAPADVQYLEPPSFWNAAISTDGRTLALVSKSMIVDIWDLESRKPTGISFALQHDSGHSFDHPTVTLNGSLLACCDMLGHMRLWDIKTGKAVTSTLDHERLRVSFGVDIFISSKKGYFVSLNRKGQCVEWPIRNKPSVGLGPLWGFLVFRWSAIRREEMENMSLIDTPDSSEITGNDEIGYAKLLFGKPKVSFPDIVAPIVETAYLIDDQPFMSLLNESALLLWNSSESSAVELLRDSVETLNVVAFSSDDALLAAGGLDGEIYVWSTVTSRLVGATQIKGTVIGLQFQSNPDRLVIAIEDESGAFDCILLELGARREV